MIDENGAQKLKMLKRCKNMDIREKIWRRNLNGYKFKERVYETNATKYDIFM